MKKICLGGVETPCKVEILNKEDEEAYFYKVIEQNKQKPQKKRKAKGQGRGRGRGKKQKRE